MKTDQLRITRSILPKIDQFIQLIIAVMKCNRTTGAELSRRTGIGTSKLSRGLNGRSSLDGDDVETLMVELGIDRQRALLAIGHLGDWRQYFDPDVELMSGLLGVLPETMAEARGQGERVAIGDVGIRRLADLISSMVANNDREVIERRDGFLFEGKMRQLG